MFGFVITSILAATVGGIYLYSIKGRSSKKHIDVLEDFSKLKCAYKQFRKVNILELKDIVELKKYMCESDEVNLSLYKVSGNSKFVIFLEPVSEEFANKILEHVGENSFYSEKTKQLHLSLYNFNTSIKEPQANITYEPNTDIYTDTKITWLHETSEVDGDEFKQVEWKNNEETYDIPGKKNVKLRVQDKHDIWSEWTQVEIDVLAHGKFKAIECGGEHYFRLIDSGSIEAMGKNKYGEIGSGGLDPFNHLEKIKDLCEISSLSAGDNHTIFRTFDKSVYTCGNNDFGQLGIGTRIHSKTLQKIWGLEDIKQVAAGPDYSGVIMFNGDVMVWGSNENGQLSDEKTSYFETPKKIEGISNAKMLAMGATHILCIVDDGEVMGWGSNSYGQLGHNPKTKQLAPSFCGIEDAFYIAAGNNFSVIVLKSGKVMSFGNNQFSQLGYGDNQEYEAPQIIKGLTSIVKVVAKHSFSIALDSEGNLYTWGRYGNNKDELYRSPVKIKVADKAIDISVSYGNGFALLENGRFAKWNSDLEIVYLDDIEEY